MHGERCRSGHALRFQALFAAVLLAGACEGSNLFVGEVADDAPMILDLDAPDFVDTGGVVTVNVTATSRRGVEVVEVRYTGAVADTDRIGFDGLDETVVATSTLTLFAPVDSLLFIEAFVEDVAARKSASVFDTVRVEPQTQPGAQRRN